MPSLSPPSPVRPKRSRSRSLGSAICTSEARTGSVGARIAPSKTAAPTGKFKNHTPTAVTAPTVSSIDTVASCTGICQRLSLNGNSSFIPDVNNDISSATSVSRSSKTVFLMASSFSSPQPQGPMAIPTARYTIAALSGSRVINEPPKVLAISSVPTMMQPSVKTSGSIIIGVYGQSAVMGSYPGW